MSFSIQSVCTHSTINAHTCAGCGCSRNDTIGREEARFIFHEIRKNISSCLRGLVAAQRQLGDDVRVCWFFQFHSLFDALHSMRLHAYEQKSAGIVYDKMVGPYASSTHASLTTLMNDANDDAVVFMLSIAQRIDDRDVSHSEIGIIRSTSRTRARTKPFHMAHMCARV